MSKPSKENRRGNRSKPTATLAPRRSNSGATFTVVALVAVAALGVWGWRTRTADAPPSVTPTSGLQATNTSAPTTVLGTKPQFQKLIGKWQRPDGGYIIEIKGVDADGKLDAAYFNPTPIHVAKALAAMDGTALKLFIELQDVNYPGSTYTMVYAPGGDYFTGVYYQALQQQSFEVNFVRMK